MLTVDDLELPEWDDAEFHFPRGRGIENVGPEVVVQSFTTSSTPEKALIAYFPAICSRSHCLSWASASCFSLEIAQGTDERTPLSA